MEGNMFIDPIECSKVMYEFAKKNNISYFIPHFSDEEYDHQYYLELFFWEQMKERQFKYALYAAEHFEYDQHKNISHTSIFDSEYREIYKSGILSCTKQNAVYLLRILEILLPKEEIQEWEDVYLEKISQLAKDAQDEFEKSLAECWAVIVAKEEVDKRSKVHKINTLLASQDISLLDSILGQIQKKSK